MKTFTLDSIAMTATEDLIAILTDTYAKNRAALANKYPEVAAILDKESADIQAFTADRENEETFISFHAGRKESKIKIPEEKDIVLTEQDKNDFSEKIVVFSDIFPGADILKLARLPLSDYIAVNKFPTRTPLYIIEPSVGKFKAMLCLYDFTEALLDGRFVFFIGKNCLNHFKARLEDDQTLMPDILQISDMMDEIAGIINHVATERAEELQMMQNEICRYYNEKYIAHWRRIFQYGKRIKIVLMVSRWTQVLFHVARDMDAAFKELGHEVELITEKNHVSATTPFSDTKALYEVKPDLLILISHLRHEYTYIPKNIPTVSYIQDAIPPITDGKLTSKIGDYDILIPGNYGLDGTALTKYGFKPENIQNVCFLVTKPEVYHPIESEETLSTCRADLSFVSNHSATPYEKFLEWKASAYLQGISDRAVKEQFSLLMEAFYSEIEKLYANDEAPWAGCQYEEILLKLSKKFLDPVGVELKGASKNALVYYFWLHIGAKFLRHRVLRWLKDENMPFKLYGAGWDKNHEFAHYSRGIIQSGEELCKVFNASKINLHIDYSALHLRVCDGWASGGFFLFNYTPLSELPQKRPEIHAVLQTIRKKSTVNEIASHIEDPVAESIARFMFHNSFYKTGEDVLETEEIKLLLEYPLPESYLKFQEFISYKNKSELYYKSRQEFIEKVKFYAENEAERKNIIQETRSFIKNYTYKHLCADMLSAVHNHFKSAEKSQPK